MDIGSQCDQHGETSRNCQSVASLPWRALRARSVEPSGQSSNYLIEIDDTNSRDEGIAVIKRTTLALNDLNSRTNYSLIETWEREQICEAILQASSAKGYNEASEDSSFVVVLQFFSFFEGETTDASGVFKHSGTDDE